ncbi:MAG: hypothetical protein MK289_22570 [Trichodesmium sp. ALOHA_ZT_67]|nr:hypothetical protein [Trichodesmium sp. ALOHA_ZT_67]MDE5096397.1 hypothetical protein [Trichodesmium sp. St11_bin5]MDT9338251.1 hypothetical protein [Trichodesmium erythraeum 21-75]
MQERQETKNNQLFTDFSTEESATINGGHRYYGSNSHRGYYSYGYRNYYPRYYRRSVRYYSHSSYSYHPYHHGCY